MFDNLTLKHNMLSGANALRADRSKQNDPYTALMIKGAEGYAEMADRSTAIIQKKEIKPKVAEAFGDIA